MANTSKPLIVTEGFRELQRLFAKTDKESRKQMDELEREVARPVAAAAESFAIGGIQNPPVGYGWETMRIGVTRTLVYVAPKKRGVKPGNPRGRKKFAPLMMTRAMEPAAVRTQPILEQRTQHLFDEIARRWGGIHSP
jgi:hypothetical protein